MIINLKSRFAPTEDRDYLVQLLMQHNRPTISTNEDDGITQSATVKERYSVGWRTENKTDCFAKAIPENVF